RSTLSYLNPAAFSAVPVNGTSGLPVRPGNVGRNAVYGPGLWNVDLSLSKAFSFTERVALRITGDALNAFNHTNYAAPVVDITSATFGRFTSTFGSRSIQLSARLSF